MKRITLFCASVILCLCLSIGAMAGQTKPGGAYCSDVDCVMCFDSGCEGGTRRAAVRSGGEIKDTSSASPQGDVMSDISVFALALFMAYRMRL